MRVTTAGVPSQWIAIETLSQVAEGLWLRVSVLPAVLKKRPSELRHCDVEGEPLFQITAGADGESVVPQIQHKCALPTCSVSLVDPNHAVNHSAWHRLFTPMLLPEDETCALCLGPAAACPSYIVKTSSLQPRIFCVMFSPGAVPSDAASGVKFTNSGMSNSSAGLPSTNFPIVCPVCEPTLADAAHKLPSQITSKISSKKLSIMRPAVMKYNFRAHWAKLHATTDMPVGLSDVLKLAPNERALLGANKGGKVSTMQLKALALV